MVGDSDEELVPEEDENGEAGFSQPTPQELRLERQQQKLAQNTEAPALQDEEDRQQEAESDSGFSPPGLPSWVMQGFPDASESGEEEPSSFTTQPHAQQKAARNRGQTAPYRSFTQEELAALRAQHATGSAALSGWQSVRRHSYWLIPILLVAAFSLLLVVTHSRQVWAIFFIFTAVGLLQSAVLLYAPNDAFWAVGVGAGFMVFVSITFFALFLPIFALVLSILLFSLGGVALRERSYPVKEGEVAVMRFGKRYSRTLQPGFNLCVPGEKAVTFETHSMPHKFTTSPIPLASGEQVLLSVALNFRVIPEKAYLVIQIPGDWQAFIKQQVQTTVQEEVKGLTLDHFRYPGSRYPLTGALSASVADESDEDEEDTSSLKHLNQHLTYVMRKKFEGYGVMVSAVRVHLPHGLPLPGGAQVAGHQPSPTHAVGAPPDALRGMGQIVEGSLQSIPPTDPAAYPVAPPEQTGQPVLPYQPSLPGVALPARSGIVSTDILSEPVTLSSAHTLAELYQAVMDHVINDPITITRIIRQFERVAANPKLSQEVDFDAAAGADNLMEHLYRLQKREHSALPQHPDGGAAPSSTLPQKGN
jgi:SPFH domain / Band 7 family